MKNSMNRTRAVGSAIVGAIAAVGLTAIVLSLGSSGVDSAAAAVSFEETSWGDQLSILDQVDSERESLPEEYTTPELERSSAVQLGSNRGFTYWAALGQDGQLCFLLTLDGPNHIAAWTCADEEQFAAHGIGTQVHSLDGSVRAFLIPDGIDARGTALAPVGGNVLVDDPFTSFAGAELAGDSGTVSLLPFDEAESFEEIPE